MTLPTADLTTYRQAMARSIGLAAFVYGYPLTESMRTCRLQTKGSDSAPARASINQLHHVTAGATDLDRDIVTPANDLLYTTAWIYLAAGPQLLTVPSARQHPGRYFVLALYDAYTENFENLGLRNCDADGETVVLVGSKGEVPPALQHHRIVRCPTDLVWLIGRILVGDSDDLAAARALQSDIQLAPAMAGTNGPLPLAVAQWEGEPLDIMTQAFEQQRPAAEVAPRFYRHLCLALAEAPGRTEDQGLVTWLAQGGLVAGPTFSWDAVEPELQAGLLQGFADGVALVGTASRSRRARPWVLASRAGRYASDYLVRALTAYIGLGALATDEALYGAGHFDVDGQLFNGARRYTLRFEAHEMPPVEAFWSVTLYADDRYLYPNVIGRHAIGDRTRGLYLAQDGSLTITFSHDRPQAGDANWMPTPAGRFYLILRLYHPRDGVRSWKIPQLHAQLPQGEQA
ncbi:MAG: DUF1254 domain-containing protein [Rhodoferax sp.]|nr:DUF1254 domain-containing protein [Rhodoferax sp.]